MYSVIAADGKSYGPVDVNTLRNWCIEGRVTPTTNIIDAVSGRTMRAADLHDLYDLFPKGPPQHAQPYAQPQATTQMHGQPQTPPGFQQQQPYNGAFGNPYQQQQQGQYGSPYRSPYPGAPYAAQLAAPKSKVIAIILAIFLGGLGIHRFYLGYTNTGVIQLIMSALGILLLGIPNLIVAVWVIIDIIQIATDKLPDAQGQPLTG